MSRAPATIAGVAAGLGLMYWAGFTGESQWFGTFPFRGPTTDKVVALTFDDGPNEPHTSRLLDVLAGHDVRATFFQVGACVERFPAVSRRVLAEGHVLGNHSYSHAFTGYLREPGQGREIARGRQAIEAATGVSPALYRPPWLCHWPWVLGSVHRAGLQVVSGTFGHPLEVFQPSGDRMARHAARLTRPGSILIFHDGREARGGPRAESVAAVDPLIRRLRDDGYRFVGVDELLGVRAYAPAHPG